MISNLGFLPPFVWEAVNFVISLGVVTVLFTLILRFVPDARLPWRDILSGAALTAVLFTLGKTLIGIYLGKAGVGSAYGAAGSLVVLVVWIYYSAQIFFFGAMFTRVYAASHGWQPAAAPKATAEPAKPAVAPEPATTRRSAEQPDQATSWLAKVAAAGLVITALISKGRTGRARHTP
jgi:membrane protein